MPLAAKGNVHAVVAQALALKSLADTHRREQVHGSLLEYTCTHTIDHVVAATVLDDDRIDAIEMQQMPEEQAGRTGADDADLCSQNPVLHVKFAASSVLPEPLYFATRG